MAQMETGKPTTKVIGGSIGAALATLIIPALEKAESLPSGTSVEAVITALITFVIAYWVSPAPGDRVVEPGANSTTNN